MLAVTSARNRRWPALSARFAFGQGDAQPSVAVGERHAGERFDLGDARLLTQKIPERVRSVAHHDQQAPPSADRATARPRCLARPSGRDR